MGDIRTRLGLHGTPEANTLGFDQEVTSATVDAGGDTVNPGS